MNETAVRKYLLVSGAIFGFVALVHLFRIVKGLAVQFGQVAVPMWGSWLGLVFAAAFCGWAFSLARK